MLVRKEQVRNVICDFESTFVCQQSQCPSVYHCIDCNAIWMAHFIHAYYEGNCSTRRATRDAKYNKKLICSEGESE